MLIGTCPFPNQSGPELKGGILGAKSDDWKHLSSGTERFSCLLAIKFWYFMMGFLILFIYNHFSMSGLVVSFA